MVHTYGIENTLTNPKMLRYQIFDIMGGARGAGSALFPSESALFAIFDVR
jgi:hypothetical protein